MYPVSALSIIQNMAFDNIIMPTDEQLAVAGIEDTGRAIRNLELIQKRLGREAFSLLMPVLTNTLPRIADPDAAINNLERFIDSLEDRGLFIALCSSKRDIISGLLILFGSSRFLSQFVVSSPDENLSLISAQGFLSQYSRARLETELGERLKDCRDDTAFYRELRRFRKLQMLRIGMRDLMKKAELQETVSELSLLAEVCLEAAYHRIEQGMREKYGNPMIKTDDGKYDKAGLCVIAMGKLGGMELNFSSDIDLMYVYSANGETEGVATPHGVVNRITNHEYFVKLSEKLTSAIGDKTEDGFVFRVDLRLRPEGQAGPLCQSLGGCEIYYESWGQTWERAALIKARPVAGDLEVGREFMDRIAPFVFRKYLDYGAIQEIKEMKQKINREVELKGRLQKDVKLGYGGIREIEFIVQALQLIYAGRDRSLREKNTLKALHMLSQKGLITYDEQEILSRAYIFLRTLEHRIQIQDDLQTQTIPSDQRELRILARRMGYLEAGHEIEQMLDDYKAHTMKVRRIYDALFAFTGEPAGEAKGDADYAALMEPETSEEEAVDILKRSGFRDPMRAYRNLLLMREGPAFVHQTPRARRIFNRLFLHIFREITTSPDPDLALHLLESFIAARGSWDALPSILVSNPDIIRIPIAIFSNSEYFGRMLVRSPGLFEDLLDQARPFGISSKRNLKEDLLFLLSQEESLSGKLDSLRRFKNREEIRIGMADILSLISLRQASASLSRLAEACLDVALGLAVLEVSGGSNPSGMEVAGSGIAIMGMGKLGGREITYGSDLDISFVFSERADITAPTGMTFFEYFNKVAERTVAYLTSITREGFAYRVDTRLRPGGSKGPLCQSIDAFRNYYSGAIQTWERQALINVRPVAGDRAVGTACVDMLKGIIYKDTDRHAIAADIREMRRRMESEIGKETADHYNIKQGIGGLVDIEFVVQFMQLVYGTDDIKLRVPGTYNALVAIKRRRLIPHEKHKLLIESYHFLRQLESRMRIVTNQATNELSKNPERLWTLARRMGYMDNAETAGIKLLRDYERVRREVRRLFDEILV